MVKNLAENDFFLLSQEFNVTELELLKEKGFYLMTTGMALKNSKKACLAKKKFILC